MQCPMCCFGGLFAGRRNWVGVREVLEGINRGHLMKRIICSSQEPGIFPEGTVCIIRYNFLRMFLLQHRDEMRDGDLKS